MSEDVTCAGTRDGKRAIVLHVSTVCTYYFNAV